MKLESATVTFKSSEAWYEIECQGYKPSTVRLMSPVDYLQLAEYDPTHITIQKGDDEGTCFTRTVKSIYQLGEMLGTAVVIVSWEE